MVLLDRYAGTNRSVFDFTNDPGIIHYLLGTGARHTLLPRKHGDLRVPRQHRLISELSQRSRPSLVVFNDNENGLSAWDGVLNMVRHYDVSQYLLDHYRAPRRC